MVEAPASIGMGKRAGDGEWAFLIPPPGDVAAGERPRAWGCCWSMGVGARPLDRAGLCVGTSVRDAMLPSLEARQGSFAISLPGGSAEGCA